MVIEYWDKFNVRKVLTRVYVEVPTNANSDSTYLARAITGIEDGEVVEVKHSHFSPRCLNLFFVHREAEQHIRCSTTSQQFIESGEVIAFAM